MTQIEAELKEAAKVMEHTNRPGVMEYLCHYIEGGSVYPSISLHTEGIFRGFEDMRRFYVPALVEAIHERLLEIEAEMCNNRSGKDEESERLRKLYQVLTRTLDMWEDA